VAAVAPEVTRTYLPHAVASEVFNPVTTEQKKIFRKENLGEANEDRFLIFWNNRNARRKQSGTLVFWFDEWMRSRGLEDKVMLMMHTDPYDVHGQDLAHIAEYLGLTENQILFSVEKLKLSQMNVFYNMADVTVNISDAEGFGLATLESLSCATPIIVTMTGGLQEQVIAGANQCGIPLFPTSKSIIGSQQVPYIYEDRINKDHFISALNNMYDMGEEGRNELGNNGRKHVLENYNFDNFQQRWLNLMLKIHEEEGSWETRKKYNRITFKEVA
jgi:glycosyltransferase involved in cell wall biosynthesis